MKSGVLLDENSKLNELVFDGGLGRKLLLFGAFEGVKGVLSFGIGLMRIDAREGEVL